MLQAICGISRRYVRFPICLPKNSKSNFATQECHYTVLGISKASSDQQIRAAYIRLAKEWHPDINKNDQANKKFALINEAYRILSDETAKSVYDKEISNKSKKNPPSTPTCEKPPKRTSYTMSKRVHWWDFEFEGDSPNVSNKEHGGIMNEQQWNPEALWKAFVYELDNTYFDNKAKSKPKRKMNRQGSLSSRGPTINNGYTREIHTKQSTTAKRQSNQTKSSFLKNSIPKDAGHKERRQ
ncbi:heat shock protein Hsp40 [Reticulomyxa filosa]|uniref:Heat shock protein Hsp40 n=1 Tax=Reticulomyxa filosa TaxID=46433 RepID=X6ME74_RETFI|nr:heat shock protein Hsp40 [Reticulomyxa filosa]|eukprot:ETO12308.1 heat shock protein Hsp40 [Reticulomyxa filosa]